MELAIDTSTNFAGIALSHDGSLISEVMWYSVQRHTVELVPSIERMLVQCNVSQKELSAIFVAKGPGSFNGLRVGISVAKGLAFARNIPLVGVSTLEVESYPFAFTGLLLCPIHNAGRGEIATALFRQDREWRCFKEEHITTVEELCRHINEKTILCGEIPEVTVGQLHEKLGANAIIPEFVVRIRRPGYLSMLGYQKLQRGEQDNPASMQPLYLRQPPITQRKGK